MQKKMRTTPSFIANSSFLFHSMALKWLQKMTGIFTIHPVKKISWGIILHNGRNKILWKKTQHLLQLYMRPLKMACLMSKSSAVKKMSDFLSKNEMIERIFGVNVLSIAQLFGFYTFQFFEFLYSIRYVMWN